MSKQFAVLGMGRLWVECGSDTGEDGRRCACCR